MVLDYDLRDHKFKPWKKLNEISQSLIKYGRTNLEISNDNNKKLRYLIMTAGACFRVQVGMVVDHDLRNDEFKQFKELIKIFIFNKI